MKPSERFLTALRGIMDDDTMTHVAVCLGPILNAADGGVYHFGRWEDDEDHLVSADKEAEVDAADVRSMLSAATGISVADVLPVHLKDLNRPTIRRAWMAKNAELNANTEALSRTMGLILAASIGKPFDEVLVQKWSSRTEDAAANTGPAIAAISEDLGRALRVRFSMTDAVPVTPGVSVSLPGLVLAGLIETLRLFLGAIAADDGKVLRAVTPTIHLLDSCIPLGTKHGNERTILLLVE